ncbi:UNVERIFIED_ORG: hypothetical protein ABIB19_003631 [Arthrobacter sp. UYEF10]
MSTSTMSSATEWRNPGSWVWVLQHGLNPVGMHRHLVRESFRNQLLV